VQDVPTFNSAGMADESLISFKFFVSTFPFIGFQIGFGKLTSLFTMNFDLSNHKFLILARRIFKVFRALKRSRTMTVANLTLTIYRNRRIRPI
jgi:hypothetical protein